MRYAPPLRANGRLYYTHPASRMGLDVRTRVLSAACYLGLAPWLWFAGTARQRNILSHHTLHGLAFSFSLLCAAVFGAVTDAIQYWLIVYVWRPTLAEFDAAILPFGYSILAINFLAVICVVLWCLAWLVSVNGARRGRTPQIPVISWLAAQYDAVNIAAYWSLLLEALILVLIGVGVRSVQITNTMTEKADVYILYTVGGYVELPGLYETITPPRWAVTFAFYPLVQAGIEKYGEGGVTALPLSEDSFNQAIRNGKFIFVASHGGMSSGAFTISNEPYKEYKPSDVNAGNVGGQLQYIYFAGCFTGDLEAEWKQALGVDDAKIFNRLSFVDEHMLWAWFKSPGVIAGLY